MSKSTKHVLALTLVLAAAQAWAGEQTIHMMTTPDAVPGSKAIERQVTGADLDQAIAASRAYLDATTYESRRAAAFNNLCIGYTMRGEFERARGFCNKAIDEKRHTEVGYLNRGVLNLVSGNVAASTNDFEAALAIDPTFSEARKNLALAQRQIADRDNQNLAQMPRE